MRSKLIIGVLALFAGLLLGTTSAASEAAGHITGKQIKNNSVTGKDVKESSLKVVPSATNLAGRSADSYLNRSYRYRLVADTLTSAKVFSFPGLPAGSYLVTYAGVFAGTNTVGCQLGGDSTTFTTGEDFTYSATAGTNQVNHGSALLTVAPGKTAALQCTSSGAFSVHSGADAPSSAIFTRIDSTVDEGTSPVS